MKKKRGRPKIFRISIKSIYYCQYKILNKLREFIKIVKFLLYKIKERLAFMFFLIFFINIRLTVLKLS